MKESIVNESQFVKIIESSVNKKVGLFEQSKGRYFVRSMFAGAMLVFATAIGVYAADYINVGAPNLGKFVYSFLFAFGLLFILFLHQELVTSNMMYLTAGTYHKFISPNKTVKILLFCTLGNLVGAVLAAFLVAQTGAFSHLTAESFIVNTVNGKLGKDLALIFIEGIMANIFVNIAILGYLLAKEEISKIIIVFGAIFMFVFLGYEHVVANFGSFSLVAFSNYQAEAIQLLPVLSAWIVAWIANYIGGGLVIGLVYAWLNDAGMVLHD
ncbi:formate/nitrite transporter family protein [Facklamia miroungae]|uniref:Formate/nitrite transporter FocA, FNT family n=1 Tax=Facklamia miroungae TaxID=120956 RepID=A0A1G7S4D8_9LACT|nr:formate/nitrite transporter family protein [Facklamia miroungae]NKZ29170.1 formate/nitrite transporter family protein [Facklamia miroungae]SDG17858.1 Formate/nitrite transporter FocA, FNT family [Facklamia miroungae]